MSFSERIGASRSSAFRFIGALFVSTTHPEELGYFHSFPRMEAESYRAFYFGTLQFCVNCIPTCG
jgi:hypothetical protein